MIVGIISSTFSSDFFLVTCTDGQKATHEHRWAQKWGSVLTALDKMIDFKLSNTILVPCFLRGFYAAMKTPGRWRALPRHALFVSILAQSWQRMSRCQDVMMSRRDVTWHSTPSFRYVAQMIQPWERWQTDRHTHRQTGPILYPRPLTREGKIIKTKQALRHIMLATCREKSRLENESWRTCPWRFSEWCKRYFWVSHSAGHDYVNQKKCLFDLCAKKQKSFNVTRYCESFTENILQNTGNLFLSLYRLGHFF